MASTHFKSLERVFPARDLFRGKALRALLWGIFASVALCFLLVDVCLVADLLETRGRLPELTLEQAPDFAKFVNGSDETEPAEVAAAMLTARDEGGLRSVAWRTARPRFWARSCGGPITASAGFAKTTGAWPCWC